jgi:DNA repair protein RadC
MYRYTTKLKSVPIKRIRPGDRPREKLKEMGPAFLSNKELIAVLLGSGVRGKDVFRVAEDIEHKIRGDIGNAKKIRELQQIHGIGPAKAAQISAAFELSQRYLVREKKSIIRPEDILPFVEELCTKKQEYFVTVTVDGASCVIKKRVVFIGTLNQTLVHPREVFADVITDRAKGVFLIHNHPSGNCRPSAEDIDVTGRLVRVGEIIGIEIIDHLIVGKNEYFSFIENKLL